MAAAKRSVPPPAHAPKSDAAIFGVPAAEVGSLAPDARQRQVRSMHNNMAAMAALVLLACWHGSLHMLLRVAVAP